MSDLRTVRDNMVAVLDHVRTAPPADGSNLAHQGLVQFVDTAASSGRDWAPLPVTI